MRTTTPDFEAMVEKAVATGCFDRGALTASGQRLRAGRCLKAAGVPDLLAENARLREGLTKIVELLGSRDVGAVGDARWVAQCLA